MVLRVLSRKITKLGLARDDWTFLGGSSIAVALFIVSAIYAFNAGLGEHWVALTLEQKALFLKLNYAYNIFNLSCYPIIKLSILLLYLRIFITPSYHFYRWAPQFRILCWAGIVFLSCMTFIVSIIRIVYYLDYTAEDPSWSFWRTAFATPAEVCLAVVVASAPTWRPVGTYTARMASSIFSSRNSNASFKWSTAHSQAVSDAITDTGKERSVFDEEEISRGSYNMEEREKREIRREREGAEQRSESTSRSELSPEISATQRV
ncbi:MAG: hypothetical protein Q9227_006098 [Pyrenula ochraceoflavens]